jgi:hypothetical protein
MMWIWASCSIKYKEQSKLRQQLQDAIQVQGLGDDAQKLVRDMQAGSNSNC